MEALDEAGISYTVFNHIGANPTSDMVEEGVKLYHEKGCQAIIAFGGGSPMDCAKGIGARIARPNKSIVQLQGLLKVFKKYLSSTPCLPPQVQAPKPLWRQS